jgi:hypothetical protein
MGVDSWAETKAKKVRDTYFKEKFKLCNERDQTAIEQEYG